MGLYVGGHSWAAARFISDSVDIIDSITEVNEDYVPLFFEDLNRIADKNKGFTLGLATNSKKLLDVMGVDGYMRFIDVLDKLSDKNEDFADLIAWEYFTIAESGSAKNIDLVLIQYIRDLKDAQIVSQVIDMDKYQDAYKEKVSQFY